jgi:ubiquinone/menaquinone biosynthesis C-methylase UbiE
VKYMSFDGMASLYDETRVFDISSLDSALDFLISRFPPHTFPKLLEPGIGTGRIAIPLAGRGYQVIGVDISEEMMKLLEKRLSQSERPVQMSFHKADVLDLPFLTGSFDIVIAVHLFYFIREWRKAVDEILRVLKEGNPLVLMHTGTGSELPFLNERYRELCSELGYSIESIGVKSTKEVVSYLGSLGCRVEWVRDRWQWTAHVGVDKALRYIRARAYSFTTTTPEAIHSEVIRRLESELQQRFGRLATTVEIPNQIYFVFVLRS